MRLGNTKPQAGQIYKHIKGSFYEVLHIGTHTETLEELVVYRPVGGDKIWIRPVSMWYTVLRRDEEEVTRFTLVDGEGLTSSSQK